MNKLKIMSICLSLAAMASMMTACGNSNTENSIPVDVSVAETLSSDYRFSAESTYYGYNPDEQVSSCVAVSEFSYLNADTGVSISGKVTETGDLEADKGNVTYTVEDGKITITADDVKTVLTESDEQKYVAFTQLMKARISGETPTEAISDTETKPDVTTAETTVKSTETTGVTETTAATEGAADVTETSVTETSESVTQVSETEAVTEPAEEAVSAGFTDAENKFSFDTAEDDTGYTVTLKILEGNADYFNAYHSAEYTVHLDALTNEIMFDDAVDESFSYSCELKSADEAVQIWWTEADADGKISFRIKFGETVQEAELHK